MDHMGMEEGRRALAALGAFGTPKRFDRRGLAARGGLAPPGLRKRRRGPGPGGLDPKAAAWERRLGRRGPRPRNLHDTSLKES
jgi:hypothetical protein